MTQFDLFIDSFFGNVSKAFIADTATAGDLGQPAIVSSDKIDK